MRVSGFSFVRDAVRLHYPIAEAIRSALPLVDDFVVAVGPTEDGTIEAIRAIGDPRVRILETNWDPAHFVHGRINAVQTDLAMDACGGEWGLYLQADEVLHEDDLPLLRAAMERWRDDPEVDGFLFDWLHFWGDFEHVQWTRNWYRHEVRIVRMSRGIRSWKSAQGFRRDGRKLQVRSTGARVFHYGWVRPPDLMKRKQIALDRLHHPEDWVLRRHAEAADTVFRYGPNRHLKKFTGTHPAVMREWIAATAPRVGADHDRTARHEHNRWVTRAITRAQDQLFRRQVGVYTNYRLIGPA